MSAAAVARAEDASPFGHDDKNHAGLIAIIYDLKQTQKRQPSRVSSGEYPAVISDFLSKGWDEEVLNRFFRVTRPLYATQVFIPGMEAGAAPKAFGVQDVIKPSEWVIHYKGQVSPPRDGVYRFAGYADDVMAAAVNGKTVLIGCRPDMDFSSVWKSKESPGAFAFNGNLVYGDWVEMHKGQPIDLDVLVGERPGGDFCAFLLYEIQGQTYGKDKDGKQILPVFQLAAEEVPAKDPGRGPSFIRSPELWQQHR
jgi:hypothetical protein